MNFSLSSIIYPFWSWLPPFGASARRYRCSTHQPTLRIVSCGIGFDVLGPGLASISEARASACVSTYSRIFVTLPLRTVMAKIQSSLNGLFVALIFPVATPTTRTRSPCAMNLGGLWEGSFHLFGCLLKHIHQSRVPAVRAGQRPVLARNDPLNIFGSHRKQTLLIAAAECRKKILHNLDIVFDAH